MKILFVKEVEGAGTHKIDLINDEGGNAAVENVFIDVPADVSVSVKGSVIDTEDSSPRSLSVISLNGLEIKASITTAGIYVVDTTGLSSLVLTITGDDPVVVKALC